MGCRIRLRFVSLLQQNHSFLNSSGVQKSSQYSSSSVKCPGADYNYDVVVVGGGIVGIATAREIKLRQSELKMCIVEKEPELGLHQTARNSGVIHAGVYYAPGSLKAKLCVKGSNLSYEYFDKYDIPYEKCGKLIVATNKTECKRLADLHERGKKNQVKDLELIHAEEIKEIEPNCKGLQALYSPHTGIVEWREVALKMADNFKESGGEIFTNFDVEDFRLTEPPKDFSKYPVTIFGKNQCIRASFVLTCGGLQSDELAALTGCKSDTRIVPVRGEYLILNEDKRHLVKGNIYPVPDPRYPFLGVHFTPRMDGTMLLGPNAVLAFKREGYKWNDYDVKEMADIIKFPGFRKMAFRNAIYGTGEVLKSLFMSLQLRELQKYIPALTINDISKGPAGVRAQAMDSSGKLVDDFVFDKGSGDLNERILHCLNAPSPACTSALAIAEVVADRVEGEMDKHTSDCS